MALSLPSSSSSSSTSKWSYDVFLSFRGEDTRNSFISHLYYALCHYGIKTYKDDQDLERGEPISPTLLKAIEESMVSIIVLSTNYASSRWCLEELSKILECKNTKQQIVLPVFYRVDPSDVRNQRNSFGEALTKHQERFKDTEVQKWKAALKEVGNLVGEHFQDGNESEFIQKIVQRVSSKINKSRHQLNIPKYVVGVGSRLKGLNTLLKMERSDITLMIGIYGVGGIGKTTIAKVAYNSIAEQFEVKCFLNVREISNRGDDLGKILHYQVFGDSRNFNVGSVGGIDFIKQMFHYKRVLLILDDVNKLHQLEELAGNHNWFGLGSRIIITTRDQHLLRSHDVDSTYEVLGLDNKEAIQLFSSHAFKRDRPIESYAELTKCIIGYAKGLPLALTVLGSYLRGRSIQEWESTLEKYERSLPEDIYKILRISYDGLEDIEKDIFLDIACFFKGKELNYVKKILDDCGFSSTIGIKRLREMCLIDIVRNFKEDILEMHDLLQEMGKEIVREESPKEAGKRRRLWFYEDVLRVLEDNTGTIKVEAILLDFPENHDEKIVRLHPEAFNAMKNLRILINRNAEFSTGPDYLSNELRVFDWHNYPLPNLPSKFDGKKLTMFKITGGLIKELDGLKAKNMTRMELAGCKFLTRIPDLSSSPNLKIFCLKDCENLVEIHHSVGFLDNLLDFSVMRCCQLRIFPERLKLRSLRKLQLDGCKFLTRIPDLSSSPNLKYLHLQDCENLVEIHHSVGFLDKLLDFSVMRCWQLRIFPERLKLKSLRKLQLDGCKLLTRIPNLSSSPNLEHLLLHCENLVEIHHSVGFLDKLLDFSVMRCCQLRIFPERLKLKSLRKLQLHGCKLLTRIPNLSSSPNLEHLLLHYCENLVEIHHSVGFLDKLSTLVATGCRKLRIFPKRLKLRSLWKLELTGCSSLEDFPEIDSGMALPSSIGNLTLYLSIDLKDTSIKELPSSIENLTNLRIFDLRYTSIKELPSSIGNLAQLSTLYLSNTDIKELPSSIGNLAQLKSLILDRSSIIELPSSIGNLTLLSGISARDCKNLVHLPSSISQLESLQSFTLDGCSQPINIGKVEDGTLSTTSVVPTGEREIASTSELTPINDIEWEDWGLKILCLQFCCLSKSNFFVNNYFRNFKCLNLSGSDIVVFPQSGVRFDMLRVLLLSNCKQLKEIGPLPSSIKKVEARGCTSLESFAEISEIVFKNNATTSNVGMVRIDLYGCNKLGVDVGLPSREQRGYEGQDWACDKCIIYPGERIPRWFSYSKEVGDDNILCEIYINGAQHRDDIDKILLCLVFGLRVGSNPEMKETIIEVGIKTFDDDARSFFSEMKVNRMDLDHVWMGYCRPASLFEVRWRVYCRDGTFRQYSDDVVIKSVGVHFLMKHEENARDHTRVEIVLGVYENEEIIYDDENSEKTLGRFERMERRRTRRDIIQLEQRFLRQKPKEWHHPWRSRYMNH